MRLKIARWYFAVELNNRTLGLGWRNSVRLFGTWRHHSAEGVCSGWRVGPLFYERGPSWGTL